MKKNITLVVIYAILFSLAAVPSWRAIAIQPAASGMVIPEGHDYATTVLKDAWDMNQFSDISQALNDSGQSNLLTNVIVAGGVFSATVTALKQSSFYVLFPGYLNASLNGKTGHSHPINAATYKCLYVAAKVDSGNDPAASPDQMMIYWFADENLTGPGGTWGGTNIPLYPEFGAAAPTPRWKLYSLQLDTASLLTPTMTPWNGPINAQWRGLRLNPTLQATDFAIDWVRLTDCQPDLVSIDWIGAGPVSLSVQPVGTARDILAIASTSQNPISFDAEGLEAGSYIYTVRDSNGKVLANGDLQVKPAAVATFARPSFISGTDFATQAIGHAWDFDDPTDLTTAQCMNASIGNSLLSMDTPSAEAQPPGCHAGTPDVANPLAVLNMAGTIDGSLYRYLTFNLKTNEPQQNVPQGMVARWQWLTTGPNGQPCNLTSILIPYDAGWQTITLDLQDPVDGQVAQRIGDCPSGNTWAANTPAYQVGFKPNENILHHNLSQELHWVRLTQIDQVNRGTPFPIRIQMSVNWADVSGYRLYYTDDPRVPTQNNLVLIQAPPAVLPSNGPFKNYLPMTTSFTNKAWQFVNLNSFNWDTSTVPAGTYYLCIAALSFGSTTTSCSEAPVMVK